MQPAFSPLQIYKACGYDKHPSPAMRAGLLRNVNNNWPLIWQALVEFNMTDPLVQVGVIATIHVETGLFRPVREYGGDKYLNDKYDTRTDLGNTPARDGDGALFAGEGFVHLTGKYNHAKFGRMLGIDMVAKPNADMDPLIAAKVLCLFFREAKVNQACLARNWRLVRKRVNGGYTHYDTVFKPCVDNLLLYLEQ